MSLGQINALCEIDRTKERNKMARKGNQCFDHNDLLSYGSVPFSLPSRLQYNVRALCKHHACHGSAIRV